VTGPIRDVGQSVLLSAFVTGSGSSSYSHILLLMAMLEEDFIGNIVINCVLIM